MKKNCVICDAEFEATGRRANKKYCSKRCLIKAGNERARGPIVESTLQCDHCNSDFIVKHRTNSKPPKNRRFCSKKCGQTHHNKRWWEENKEAEKLRIKKWREENVDHIKAYEKEYNYKAYHSRTPEQIKADNERLKAYSQSPIGRERKRAYHQRPEVKAHRKQYDALPENRERKRAFDRKWNKTEKGRAAQARAQSKPEWKVNNRMRANMHFHLKRRGLRKTHKKFDVLGYTPKELMAHLESLFTDGMSWDNMGEWHIDHVRPVALFNFDSMDHPEFKECWALENLQPMWESDNLSKGSLWEGKRHRYKVIQ